MNATTATSTLPLKPVVLQNTDPYAYVATQKLLSPLLRDELAVAAVVLVVFGVGVLAVAARRARHRKYRSLLS